MVHDCINILTSVGGYIDLALAESDKAKRQAYMKRSRREVERAVKLTKDLELRLIVKANQYGER